MICQFMLKVGDYVKIKNEVYEIPQKFRISYIYPGYQKKMRDFINHNLIKKKGVYAPFSIIRVFSLFYNKNLIITAFPPPFILYASITFSFLHIIILNIFYFVKYYSPFFKRTRREDLSFPLRSKENFSSKNYLLRK